MGKAPFVKRTIVSVLCAALLLTGNLSVLASEIGEMVTEAAETTETMSEETVKATETIEAADTVEATGTAETEETVDATETAETTETVTEENVKETETEPERVTDSAAEPENAKGEQSEVKTVDYTYENDEVIITVSAEEGVLPEEAELSVKTITAGNEFAKVKTRLESDAKENNYEIAGFLAYDICFLLDGEEVEPDGTVNVVMDYKEAAIPESVKDAETTSVSVMHLEENENQVEVKNISSDSNVSFTSNNEVEKVEFVTESFSTFVIAWKNANGLQVTVHYVDQNTGNEINGLQSAALLISENETISFADYAGDIAGYEYETARLNNIWDGKEVTSVKATREKNIYQWWTSIKYYFTFYNGNEEVLKADYATDVYLVYRHVGDRIETVDTTSKGVIINLFDYKANASDNTSEYVGTVKIGDGYGINREHYLKFMNSASGNTPSANAYMGSSVRKNIVSGMLGADGFPVLSGNADAWGSYAGRAAESLSYLFNENDISDAKKAYLGANHLFVLDSDGYYSYDSAKNFATIAENEGNDFVVYDTAKGGFFPFTAGAKAYGSGCNGAGDVLGSDNVNHYFGMTIETDFIQPQSGKINGKDMVFEFSGDDDVWVFIDNKLALDLGGIHGAVSGSINFATGDVIAGGTPGTNLSDLGISLEDYSVHTMKFFYLERGNQDSNCKITFNLQTIPKGSLFVSKTAVDVADDDTSDYEFVLKDSNGNAVESAAYTIGTSSTVYHTDENGAFTLKNGQYALISGLEAGNYTVTETAVKNSNHDYVLADFGTRISVNGGTPSTITAESNLPRTAAVVVSDAKNSIVDYRNQFINQVIENTDSTLSKVIDYDEAKDEYELTLSFKAPKQEITKTEFEDVVTTTDAKVDIVLVMDMSGSMADREDSRTTKLAKAKSAVSTMVDTLSEKEFVSARWKLVTFASDAKIVTGYGYKTWNNGDWIDSETLKAAVNSLNNPTGGTNYQAGLVKGQEAAAANAREDAERIVVFLTDGEPTYYLAKNYKIDNAGTAREGGGNYTTKNDYDGAIMGADALYCDEFHAIGIGLGSNVYNGKSGLQILEDIADAVHTEDSARKDAENIRATDLKDIFKNIAGKIITNSVEHINKSYKYASNVTLTDTLSRYVDIAEDSDIVISVKNADGTEVGTCENGKPGKTDASYTFADGENNVALTAGYSDKTVTLNFPEGYVLDDDYTYAVTFTVKASEAAYEQYAAEGYADTGDADTDAEGNATSSGKKGFHSNTKAKVTYAFNDEEKTETFDHPVIQVDAAKFVLVKQDEKKEPLSGVTFTLYKDSSTTGVEKTTSEDGTLDFGYLASGSYRLVETAAPEKYAKLDETKALTFTVSKGEIAFADEVDEHWILPAAAVTTAVTGENVVNTSENLYTVTVVNDLARIYEWNIYKISASSTSDNMIYLEGAEFTLTSAEHTYYGKSQKDGKVIWYSDENRASTVEEIAAGTYTLKETLAPAGYAVNADWTLVIGADNNISGYDQKNASYDEQTKTYTICYADVALYSLPETGGAGIFAYMFGGMFFMMAGALFVFVCRRKACRS